MLFYNYGHEYTILYSHGNAEDLYVSQHQFQDLRSSLQCNLIAYDYSGYGLSQGKCSETACFNDAEAVLDFLITEHQIPRNRIILFGRSLGSGPTFHLASKHNDFAGLILQSPLRSAIRTQVPKWLAFTLQGLDIFKNQDKIKNITEFPVFIIHGNQDKVVPFEHGQYLYNEFTKINKHVVNPFWVHGCGHNDIEYYCRKEFIEKLQYFVKRKVPTFYQQRYEKN